VRDPTIPRLEDRKKFMFYDTSERQTKLRIRCKYDGINQSQFFRFMITGYLENNSNIIEYLDQCKEKYKAQGIQKRRKIMASHSKAEQNKIKFNLNEGEIESIFDIIEENNEL
tara:strand:+ start:552 stop:890 length:339 start_codon:yes stop_codon:yes gene_type:complete